MAAIEGIVVAGAARMGAIAARLAALEQGADMLERWDGIFARLEALESGQVVSGSVAHNEVAAPSTSAAAAAHVGMRPTVTPDASPTQQRLERELIEKGFSTLRFARVPGDYYEQPLEYRMQCVGAASIDHLCKSIIMENTKAHATVDGWSNPCNSKYYTVLVQYTARLNPEKIKSFVHGMSGGKIGKQWYNFRLCKPDVNDELTGYKHNAVSPIGMAVPDIPMIMSHKITELAPAFFFLGGGEVDLKLGMPTEEFIREYEPMVADITS